MDSIHKLDCFASARSTIYTTDECESRKRLYLGEAWKNGVRKFKNVLLSFESRKKNMANDIKKWKNDISAYSTTIKKQRCEKRNEKKSYSMFCYRSNARTNWSVCIAFILSVNASVAWYRDVCIVLSVSVLIRWKLNLTYYLWIFYS